MLITQAVHTLIIVFNTNVVLLDKLKKLNFRKSGVYWFIPHKNGNLIVPFMQVKTVPLYLISMMIKLGSNFIANCADYSSCSHTDINIYLLSNNLIGIQLIQKLQVEETSFGFNFALRICSGHRQIGSSGGRPVANFYRYVQCFYLPYKCDD